LLAPAGLAALALVLAGCGGGGGGSTATGASKPAEQAPAALSKTELVSQGDAICAEVNSAVGSVGSSAAGSTTSAEQVANLYANMVTSLENLGAPKEKSSQYDEFVAAANELAKASGEVKLAAEREDQVGQSEAEGRASTALEGFQSAATAYGFEKCGEGPSAPSAPTAGGEPGEEGGVEAAPEVEEAAPEAAPEEIVPETGGAGGTEEPPAEESGGSSSGGVGPG
jgi:hypothetical protein